ncbi:mast cell protease 1A-like isoform 3-T3 [Macrochelys suwanniensis]
MASLEIQDGHVKKKCGGFLVKTNFVLTAAHCDGDKITVKLGAHNISEQERSQQKIPVHRRIPHPQYKRKTLNNDIMLLQLEKSAKLNSWVGTIGLPRAGKKVEAGVTCSVAGWGRTSAVRESKLDTLQEVNVVVMPDAACLRNPYGQYNDYNPSTMMCVGDPEDERDSAKGDSGGPLVCGETAQGIVSWAPEDETHPPGCTQESPPSSPGYRRR